MANICCNLVDYKSILCENQEPSASGKAVKRIQVMLESPHEGNQITAAEEFQQLAKKDVASALAAGVLQQLNTMLASSEQTARAAAAAAIAVMCTSNEGRDAARCNGVLRPLIMLLEQQHKDPVGRDVGNAAKAIMNAAACTLAKRTIHKAGGIPTLLKVLQSGSQVAVGPFGGMPRGAPCPAAVHAAGALMNMALVKKIRETLVQLNAMEVLEAVAAQHGSNTLGIRAWQAATYMQMQFTADDFQAGAKNTDAATADASMAAATARASNSAVAPAATASTTKVATEQSMVSTEQSECTSLSVGAKPANAAAEVSTTSSTSTTVVAALEEPHSLGAAFITAFRQATAGVVPAKKLGQQRRSSKLKPSPGKAAAAGGENSAGSIIDKGNSSRTVARLDVSKGSKAGKAAVTFAVESAEESMGKEGGDWRV